jgi:hypothetical protein
MRIGAPAARSTCSRLASPAACILFDGAEACITANERYIHPLITYSQHTPRPPPTGNHHYHHSVKQDPGLQRRLSVNGHGQPTRVQPVPCPSKHCCAPWFHNRPSILARLAHGTTGTCTLGRTAARYTASAPCKRVYCLREQIKAQKRMCSLRRLSSSPARAGWTCVSSVCVNPARLRYLGVRCVTCDSAFSIIVM